jgi:predicted small lipoprotein YifL
MKTTCALLAMMLLTSCGQKGPLYLPDPGGEVVTRPTQTPPPESAGAPNSTGGVDSPQTPARPAPEVTAPDKDKKKEGAQTPPR